MLSLPRPALATLSNSTVFKAFGRPLCFFSVFVEITLEESFHQFIVILVKIYRILLIALILLRNK